MERPKLVDPYGRPLEETDVTSERFDAWANQATGLGVFGIDKSRAASYLPVWRVLDQELTNLYNGSDLAKKVVSKRPEEMFRRGFALEADNVEASECDDIQEDAAERLNLQTNFLEAMRWGRLYGGSLLVMNVDDGRYPWEPLDEDNIRSFDSLSVVDRRYSYVQSQYANFGASSQSKYGYAQIYLISNAVAGYGWNSYGVQKIEQIPARDLAERGAMVSLWHESRVIRFDGNPADIVTRQTLAGWSWSVLQVVYEALRQFEGAFDSAGYLLHDASQAVWKLQGLVKAISSGQRGYLASRMQLAEATRSVVRGVMLDAGGPDGKNAEDFHREPTSFASIPELLDRMMLRLASAADMPATELFGRAPAGMNATGENDTRKWYDTIESEQKNVLGPKLKRVFRLLAAAKDGPLKGRDVKWTVKFHPLWSPTDKELADTRLANAQRDVAYIEAGVVKPEEVAVDLFEVYPNLDIEAREEAMTAGLMFDPYENEPDPKVSALVAAPGQGEPLSPQSPVSLYGTTGTNVSAGNYPAMAAATAAGHGAQPPLKPADKPAPKGRPGPRPGPSVQRARDKAAELAKAKAQSVSARGAEAMAGKGKRQDATVSATPAGSDYEGEASIVLVWNPAGELLCISRPEPPHEMALPGGHIEPGETPTHAAIRELREEAGILVRTPERLTTILSPVDGRKVHVFLARKWRGVPRAAEAGSEMAWLTPEALLVQAETFAPSVRALRDAGFLRRPIAPGGGIARQMAAPPVEDAAGAAQVLRQDAATLAALPALLASRKDAAAASAVFVSLLTDYRSALERADSSDDIARKVYLQLGEDYPTRLLGWVLAAHWQGPWEVPLDQVDDDNRDKWTASHDGRLESFKQKISEGARKPAILVKVPGNPKYKITDGHHRFLGHEALGKPLLAYTAELHTSAGPWDTLHDSQRKSKSGPSDVGPSWRELVDPSYIPDPSLIEKAQDQDDDE